MNQSNSDETHESIQNGWGDLENAGSPLPVEKAEPESAEQIRAEIEETRAEMSQTIDALQEKLDPQHIKAQVAEKIHDATIGRAEELVHAASEKLAPATEKLSETSEKFGEAIAPVAQIAKEKTLTAIGFAGRQPIVFGVVLTAILSLFWAFYRYQDEDESTLR